MQIPYEVTARPDTGLWNAKIGIWLFLASEVMLFGGLFSSYIFLRVSATDYPWPSQELPWQLGAINTAVLIGSSVTVVLAWASLKMREWRKFQIYMAVTLACAAIFMFNKFIEYGEKLKHQYVELKDGSAVTGHDLHDDIVMEDITAVTLDLAKKPNLKLLAHGRDGEGHGPPAFTSPTGHQTGLDRAFIKSQKTILTKAGATDFRVRMEAAEPFGLHIDPDDVVERGEGYLVLYEGTRIDGRVASDAVHLHIDMVDFQKLKGDVEHAMVLEHLTPAAKAKVLEHVNHIEELTALGEEGLKRMEEEMHIKNVAVAARQVKFGHGDGHGEEGGHLSDDDLAFEVPPDAIRFKSNFGPSKNPYYAIYFTLTGLHGLHVVGGAIVLGYFLFTGKKMYLRNPEHLANRVEVGGLFWHFVDLVWIFLFPLLYLL